MIAPLGGGGGVRQQEKYIIFKKRAEGNMKPSLHTPRFIYWNAETTLKAYRRSGTSLIQGRFPGNRSNLEGKGQHK